MGAAAAAAGVPSTPQQAMQWLRQLRDNPLMDNKAEWMRRLAGIHLWMNDLLAAFDATGRPGPAIEPELFELLKLMCEVFIQLIRQAPAWCLQAAAANFKQHAAHATTENGARSNNSHTSASSGSNSSSDASTSRIKLDNLFSWLVTAHSNCVVCLGRPSKIACAYEEAGEHLPCSQTL
jgi:hypothetical protein